MPLLEFIVQFRFIKSWVSRMFVLYLILQSYLPLRFIDDSEPSSLTSNDDEASSYRKTRAY